MSDELAVVVKGVSKDFVLPQYKSATMKQAFVNIGRRKKSKDQKALLDISFDIKKGQFFGIIGRNGSGKSTLLKILAGVYTPTKGVAEVYGSLTPFIELGVGFNPELTGRDNVFLNGALLGFNRKEMIAMYDDIVEFAELKEFMGQKLKNYSSGMQVRLAFSIAIRAKSDILLIDEVLAVGDVNFQKKCIEVFEELKREKKTIVFVSHSMGYVRDFCDSVAVINKGKLVFTGDTEKGIDIYNKLNAEEENLRAEIENIGREADVKRLGNGKAVISSHKLTNHEGKETVTLEAGQKFTATLEMDFVERIENCTVGVMFRKNPQENLYGINTYYNGKKIPEVEAGKKLTVTFEDTMPLNPGTYYVSFAVASMKRGGYDDLDNLNNIGKVNVTGPQEYWGVVRSEPKITIEGK